MKRGRPRKDFTQKVVSWIETLKKKREARLEQEILREQEARSKQTEELIQKRRHYKPRTKPTVRSKGRMFSYEWIKRFTVLLKKLQRSERDEEMKRYMINVYADIEKEYELQKKGVWYECISCKTKNEEKQDCSCGIKRVVQKKMRRLLGLK